MPEINQTSSNESITDIRIVGLNRDKTRKTSAADAIYEVYLELSEAPLQAWRNIFEQEWHRLEAGSQKASVERGFLVIHCPLQEIATHLPLLKKAVAASNKTYKQYVQEQATEQEHREDAWKEERKAVDDIAESLDFE